MSTSVWPSLIQIRSSSLAPGVSQPFATSDPPGTNPRAHACALRTFPKLEADFQIIAWSSLPDVEFFGQRHFQASVTFWEDDLRGGLDTPTSGVGERVRPWDLLKRSFCGLRS